MNRAKPPKYRHHKPSGRGLVTLNGRDVYLPGQFKSKESRDAYARAIGEWRVGGGLAMVPSTDEGLTIVELLAAFDEHAQVHYRDRAGTPTKELWDMRRAARTVRKLYGTTAVADFGPLALQAVRQAFIDEGLCRRSVNQKIVRIRKIFKWGVKQQIVPAAILTGLQAVDGLQRGRTTARDYAPVAPVDEATFKATLAALPAMVADFLRVLWWTGARSGELCIMRAADIDMSGETWVYTPTAHKNSYRGQGRQIYIGPEAQAILRPYLRTDVTGFVFSPKVSEAARLADRHSRRATPMNEGNKPGSNRTRKPKRAPGELYRPVQIARAVARACAKLWPAPAKLEGEALELWKRENWWHPHAVRHSAATRFRRESGLVVAGVLLGHKSLVASEIYAGPDVAAAVATIRKLG